MLVIVHKLVSEDGAAVAKRIAPFPRLPCLGDDGGQISAASIQQVASPGDQAADIEYRCLAFVAAHGAIALFDAPTDGAFGGIVGTIQALIMRPTPSPIEGQPLPEVLAIQAAQAHAVGQGFFVLPELLRCTGLGVALMDFCQLGIGFGCGLPLVHQA